MGEDVVVQVVDVDRGHAAVEIGRHREGEELAHPDREPDLEPEPLELAPPRHAARGERAQDEPEQLGHRQAHALHQHPAEEGERQQRAEQREARARRLQEAREGEEALAGATREDAAEAGAALEDAAPSVGHAPLHEIGHAGPREVKIHARPLVVEVKARDVRAHPVHHRGLERRRRGRDAHRHRPAAVAPGAEEPSHGRRVARGQGQVQHLRGQAVDLDDEEASGRAVGRAAEARPAGDAVDGRLDPQHQVVDHRRPSQDGRASGAVVTSARSRPA